MSTFGFCGSVRERTGIGYSELVHAVSRSNRQVTVCGIWLSGYDRRDFAGGGKMETVTCLQCWAGKDRPL